MRLDLDGDSTLEMVESNIQSTEGDFQLTMIRVDSFVSSG